MAFMQVMTGVVLGLFSIKQLIRYIEGYNAINYKNKYNLVKQ